MQWTALGWWAALAGALSFWNVAPARAATLKWSAPAECPAQSVIEAEVERSVGVPLSEVHGVDFEAAIERRSARSWRLSLRTHARAPGGEVRARELSGQSCKEVSEAAVVAIAMTVAEHRAAPSDGDADPDAVLDEIEASQPGSAATGGARGTGPEPEPEPEPEPPPTPSAARGELELSGAAALVLDSSLLPAFGAGVGLEVSLRYETFRVLVTGALFAEQEAQLSDGRGGRFGLVLGAGLLCLQPSAEGLWMLGCAGIELGRLSATGILDRPLSGSATFAALRLELGGGYRLLPQVAAFVRIGVSAPLRSSTFTVDDDRLHRLGSMSGRATIGIELHL